MPKLAAFTSLIHLKGGPLDGAEFATTQDDLPQLFNTIIFQNDRHDVQAVYRVPPPKNAFGVAICLSSIDDDATGEFRCVSASTLEYAGTTAEAVEIRRMRQWAVLVQAEWTAERAELKKQLRQALGREKRARIREAKLRARYEGKEFDPEDWE